MPRNGTGTYTLPPTSWNPASTGAVIESTAWNTTGSDLASALTQSISKDGQTPWTGNDDHGNNKIINLANGASATDAMAYGQGAKLAGGNTFTGDQTINGSVSLSGSLTVSGPVIFNSGTFSVESLNVASVASVNKLNVASVASLNVLNVSSVASINTLNVSSGVVVGAASGGNKGTGTINVANAVYYNGAALSFTPETAFTPALKFGGASVGMTTGTAAGAYTRVGDRIIGTLSIILTNKGSSTGAVTITGLPVAVSSFTQPLVVGVSGMTGLTGAVAAMILGSGGTTITLYQTASTGNVALTDVVFGNSSALYVNFQYGV